MNPKPAPFLFGLFFILFGGFLLLGSAGLIHLEEEMTVAGVFASAGIVLILAHFLQKKPVWMLIVGSVSLFIGVSVYIENSNFIQEEFIGALLFIITAAVFLLQLRKGKKAWWAIIPGGFSLVMAGHVLLSMYMWHPEELHGVLFFAGMGVIFGSIYFLKDETYRLGWAKWPAGASLVMAAIILFSRNHSDIDRVILPLILIVIGGSILMRSLNQQKAQEPSSVDVIDEP